MGKGPDAADVKGAAVTEGEFSREATRDQTYANRPDQYNAFGNVTWQQENVIDPATGEATTKWSQRENMSPEMRKIFDNQMYSAQRGSEMSAGMNDRIAQEMGSPVNWEQFGDIRGGPESVGPLGAGGWSSDNRQRAEDAAYGRATNRLDPQFAADRTALERQMAGRGLRQGDQAYDAAMQNYDFGRNDAYEQARLQSVSTGRAEDAQSFDQYMGEGQNVRAADAQSFGQEERATASANALRDKQIAETLAKRKFSLGEQAALNPDIGSITQNFSTGGA